MFKASVQEARLTCQPFLGNAIAARLLLGGVPCGVWLRTAVVDSCHASAVTRRVGLKAFRIASRHRLVAAGPCGRRRSAAAFPLTFELVRS